MNLVAQKKNKLAAPDTICTCFEPGACFAAGTLVHTKEGLVPIEQIKVCDYAVARDLKRFLSPRVLL